MRQGADMKIRAAKMNDVAAVLDLYKRVAQHPGGIARLAAEIDADYVESFLGRSIAQGIALVIEADKQLVAEIHAARPEPACFSHVLSDLTIVVDPTMQGSGLGRRIFESLLHSAATDRSGILRIELIARQSNKRAIRLYRSLGFRVEGAMVGRIKNSDGSFEADIPMAVTIPPQ